jgi:adenylate cyclase class 2
MDDTHNEIEIKIPVERLEEVRSRLKETGAELVHEAAREYNVLFDSADSDLTRRGEALRIRRWGGRAVLTFKGPATFQGPIKIREELETEIGDSDLVAALFERLGFRPWIRYEKDRESWSIEGAAVTLDHTPMGDFVEIEGPKTRLGEIAARLHLDVLKAVKGSYVSLWQTYREVQGLGRDMVFEK